MYHFAEACLDEQFRDGLEETSAAFGVADLVSTTWKDITKIKLIIVTNADFRARADGALVNEIIGKPTTLSVWDLKRLKQFAEQGQARGSLVIDFKKDFGGGIPVLPASIGDETLESYLAIVPGKQLAAIYEKWGARLLEANVRSFLQAKGNVNRGIRNTIRDEPAMFFSYNNGLSTTADSIDIEPSPHGPLLVRADNLQIVNGGQTTASIHAGMRTFADQIAKVHVQMKLTIVPRDLSENIVPKISEYANSQNKVNAADFFSNHPFHVRIQELSRRVLAPAGADGYRESKWFYERARGQFADERGRRSDAERKKFDAEYPRKQFVTKTDLAKFENTWSRLPHEVSKGAQKNFKIFAEGMEKRWGSEGANIDELWYRSMIAKAIVFKATEKLVSEAPWYEGGYRANIVTYAIAKLVRDVDATKKQIDLETIWRRQAISQALKDALNVAAEKAQYTIAHPPVGVRNFSEWAKKEVCWKQLCDMRFDYPEHLDDALIAIDIAKEKARAARSEKAFNAGVEAEIEVYNLGGVFWSRTMEWGNRQRLISHDEIGILLACASIPQKTPSAKQCREAMKILEKLRKNGLPDQVGT